MTVWINGEPSEAGTVSVHDAGFVRGDGCFEALRSYGGRAFALTEHIQRLQWSAAALGMTLPVADELEAWIATAAREAGDGIVRVIATRGGPDQIVAPPIVVVISEPLPALLENLALLPIRAPWHSAGRPWELAGAKTLSYGPNVNAGRVARERGFDDALLVSDDDIVLEGPTFTIGWVIDGVVETPALDLLILDSITRRYVLNLAEEVLEGRFHLSRIVSASEVFVMSTIKEVVAVARLGEFSFEPGPVTDRLARDFRAGLIDAGYTVSPRE
ncbi:MAG: aminotransferase class IV family protein [Acidimicrobiia bacterium]|nr:aminotransferase class IV family protein [Acidimicrobiia bacterium]